MIMRKIALAFSSVIIGCLTALLVARWLLGCPLEWSPEVRSLMLHDPLLPAAIVGAVLPFGFAFRGELLRKVGFPARPPRSPAEQAARRS